MTTAHWSQKYQRKPAEALDDYIARLKALNAATTTLTAAESIYLGSKLTAAKKERAEAKRQQSPALQQAKRLVAQLSGADLQQFIVWFSRGMPDET